jgi:hypothetical protein
LLKTIKKLKIIIDNIEHELVLKYKLFVGSHKIKIIGKIINYKNMFKGINSLIKSPL